jgi:glycerol-3-phosphate dehydrogenase (NAD(P)+)
VTRAAILGAGSWGTAYAKVLADAGTDVALWARRPVLAATVRERRENPEYLPGILLPQSIRVTADAAEALAGADIVALAVPGQTLRENLMELRAFLPAGATLVSLMKGVELGTTKRMSEVIAEVAQVDAEHVAVVSGPNLAREIAQEQPAATVVACTDLQRAEVLQQASTNDYFRPYTNIDVVGCELGGAIKNVIALACGIAEGMGYGDNSKASLITRGLAETTRLGVALGADPATFAGLAGLGDLVATCNSPLSRNRTFGELLGRGHTTEAAIARTRQTAEGVMSCRAVLELADNHGIDMPITAGVVAVIYDNMPVSRLTQGLMRRQVRAE